MARRGDGIYLRRNTWWLDFTHEGTRHVARLGKGITSKRRGYCGYSWLQAGRWHGRVGTCRPCTSSHTGRLIV
jgi:hypothetical protein